MRPRPGTIQQPDTNGCAVAQLHINARKQKTSFILAVLIETSEKTKCDVRRRILSSSDDRQSLTRQQDAQTQPSSIVRAANAHLQAIATEGVKSMKKFKMQKSSFSKFVSIRVAPLCILQRWASRRMSTNCRCCFRPSAYRHIVHLHSEPRFSTRCSWCSCPPTCSCRRQLPD